MSDNIFVDTNILLYARDASEPEKQPIAAQWIDQLWDGQNGRLSVQVLNEYFVNVTRKLEPGLLNRVLPATAASCGLRWEWLRGRGVFRGFRARAAF
jgi:predicted nucleic acid-binding protein